MQITSAIVLYAVIWFVTLFVVLPLNLRTQGEENNVVPGTPSSAPADARLGRKVRIVTLVALPIWGVLVAVILSGILTVDDFDLYRRFGPDAAR